MFQSDPQLVVIKNKKKEQEKSLALLWHLEAQKGKLMFLCNLWVEEGERKEQGESDKGSRPT